MDLLWFYSFGVSPSSLPHPEAEWEAFLAAITALNDKEPQVWNPALRTMSKWVVMDRFVRNYRVGGGAGKGGSGGGCCTVM
jgi:hypothetical protein